MTSTSAIPKKSSFRLVFVAFVVVTIIAGTLLLPIRQYLLDALEWAQGLGAWGPMFVALFYIVACVLMLPGSALTLGAGFLFGVPVGLLSAWTGATIGACAAFLVGRTLARDWVASKVSGNPKFAAVDEAVGREGFKIVLLLRLSPVFPFNFLNYALGLTKVPFRQYALATLIGMLPGGLMYVYLGSAARSLADVAAGHSGGGLASWVFFWFGLATTIAVAFLVTRVARQSIRRVETAVQSDSKPSTVTESSLFDKRLEVPPEDVYNQELVSNVHPSDWKNPQPCERYNLVVIGAGTAGLVAAAGAATLGAKVALVERHLMGGDCLNYGCVPSKALIRSARAYAATRDLQRYGIEAPHEVTINFPLVMKRLRRLRAAISHRDSAHRFKDLGVDVFLGQARFAGRNIVVVSDKSLRFTKAIIATGARPVHPKIRGLSETGFLTNETIFSLVECPERLAVIGGGPIGCEMAQAFQRLGSHVILFHNKNHILDREDADAAEILQERFIKEGIQLVLNSVLREVESVGKKKLIHFEVDGRTNSIEVDEIFVGTGRAPNIEHLNLETAGVSYDARKGVFVNDNLQTTNPDIFAAGDICMNYKFTHAADAAARIAIQNALFMGSKKLSTLTIPWCTYTDPEIAHVGMYERDAVKHGVAVDTFVRPLGEVDRAVLDGEDEGFIKVHVKKGTDEILGATIVAAHAGEMISELTLAMVGKLGLRSISRVIHPYPSQAEAIKQVADMYNRSRLTPFIAKVFAKWLAWNR